MDRQVASTATGLRGVRQSASRRSAVLRQASVSSAAKRAARWCREAINRSRPPPDHRPTPTVRTETKPATARRLKTSTATTPRNSAAFRVPNTRPILPVLCYYCYYHHYSTRSYALGEYWIYFTRQKTVFPRSAITAESEPIWMKSGAL